MLFLKRARKLNTIGLQRAENGVSGPAVFRVPTRIVLIISAACLIMYFDSVPGCMYVEAQQGDCIGGMNTSVGNTGYVR